VTSVLIFVLALVGIALIALSAAHIMHVFSLIVMIRRREIGLLRALGARRSDIRVLLLTEAAFVGAAAAVLGVVLALAGGSAADWLAASRVPDFPFKPESFFLFSPWMVGAVVLLAVAACVAGALPPTLRAASGDPSDTLAGR
jgi:ABC-type antimicrobial peptide transport system permease subunit